LIYPELKQTKINKLYFTKLKYILPLKLKQYKMNIPEISAVTKLIKEIKYKLNELEKIIGKTAKAKYTYPVNSSNNTPPRKRNVYNNSEKSGNV